MIWKTYISFKFVDFESFVCFLGKKLATAEMNEIVAKAAAEEQAAIDALKEVRHFDVSSQEFSYRPGEKAEHCRTYLHQAYITA